MTPQNLGRGIAWGLAWQTVALALIGLAVWAGVAHAAPAPPAAQATADRTADWLTRTLHRPIARRSVVVQDAGQMTVACGDAKCAAYVPFSAPGTIVTTPDVADLWARTPATPAGASAGHLLRHELLHADTLTATEYGDGWVEEGAVESVNADLDGAWCRWELDLACSTTRPVWAERVAAVRAASARGTGSRTWRTRPARLWRRDLLAADAAGRQAMLAAIPGAPA